MSGPSLLALYSRAEDGALLAPLKPALSNVEGAGLGIVLLTMYKPHGNDLQHRSYAFRRIGLPAPSIPGSEE